MTNFYNTQILKNNVNYENMRTNIDMALVFYIIKFFKLSNILEVGFNEGKTFGAMIEASPPNSRLTAIDINPNMKLYDLFYKNTEMIKNKTIDIIKIDSLVFNPTCEYNLINIDTAHTYPLTINEIEKYIHHLSRNGILMLDDYAWEGVDKSIDEFLNKNKQWVPFLMGEQTLFLHHVSHDAYEFIDETLEIFSSFCSLYNINYKSHFVKKVECLLAITQNDDIFELICQRYKI
jgi:hypothetical protein